MKGLLIVRIVARRHQERTPALKELVYVHRCRRGQETPRTDASAQRTCLPIFSARVAQGVFYFAFERLHQHDAINFRNFLFALTSPVVGAGSAFHLGLLPLSCFV